MAKNIPNEEHYEHFNTNNRRYSFSLRTKKGTNEFYMVLAEKKISGFEKGVVHKIRVYDEAFVMFIDRLLMVAKIREELKKKNVEEGKLNANISD